MEIETAANPAGVMDTAALDAPAPVDAAAEANTEGAGDSGAAANEGADPLDGLLAIEADYAEIEHDGAKYKVPAPLKEAFLRHSDYTRKTMEVADQRRALETAQRQIREAQELSAAELRTFTRLDQISSSLAAFKDINWADLDHSNPDVQRAKGVRDELLREHRTLTTEINGHMQAKSARAQQETAKEREAVDAAMSKVVKDWGPDKRGQFVDFAVSKGIPADLAGQASAAEFDIIRLAIIGAQTEQQRLAALKAAASARTQPAPELGAGAGGGPSDPHNMSMEQYRAWRAKQDGQA